MKLLVLVFSTLFAVNVHAALIKITPDQLTYSTGDLVTIEVEVLDMNAKIDFLELDITYNNIELAFLDFTWVDSIDVFNYGSFGDAYVYVPGTLIVQASFLNGITTVATNSFKLGKFQYTALSDSIAVDLEVVNILAQDVNYNVIPNDQLQVSVPTPAIGLLFLMPIALLVRRKG